MNIQIPFIYLFIFVEIESLYIPWLSWISRCRQSDFEMAGFEITATLQPLSPNVWVKCVWMSCNFYFLKSCQNFIYTWLFKHILGKFYTVVVWLAFMLMEKKNKSIHFFFRILQAILVRQMISIDYFGIYANNQVDTQLDLAAIETHYSLSTNVSDLRCSTKVLGKWCGCLYNAGLYLITSLNKILPNYLSCTAECIFKNSSLIH